MKRSRLALAWAAAVALLLASCSRKAPVFPKAPVVLISIDTLRADHLPVYGYRKLETPNLDALARDGIVFDNAISQVPLTLPSHVSLLTGLMPYQNGVRDNLGYRLDGSKRTLGTLLSAAGYASGAAVSAIVLDHSTGVSQGFDLYDDLIEGSRAGQAIGEVQRAGGETEKRLKEWIGSQSGERPIFAFLHLYEPHTPYNPPEPFRSRYAKSLYDGEIAAADEIVGRFVAFLKERNLYDRGLIVLFSDHGEGLGEHGEDEHGILLYRETVRVPLFVKLPGGALAGSRVDLPAQLADVAPTVLATIGLKPPAEMPGVSLIDLAEKRVGARSLYSETLYPRYHFGWSDLASLTDGRHQYIEAPQPELYDWREDPQETRNLAAGLPPAFRALRVALQEMNRPLQAPGASDPETVKKLASLGYLGQASLAQGATELPDPKSRVGSLAKLKEANRLAVQHREEEAVALLRQFGGENPRMLDVWESLARILRGAGRPKEAIEALQRADQLAPGTPQILMGLAELNLDARDFARARSFALAAQVLGAVGVEEELSLIALAEGDVAAARRHAEAARTRSPGTRFPLFLAARADASQGKWDAALAALDETLVIEEQTKGPPIEGLRAARADVLAHLGREKDAEADFRMEVRNFPENLDAWSRLALLYASGGRTAEFQALVAEMTQRVPTRRCFEVAERVCEIAGDRKTAEDLRRRRPGPPAPSDPLRSRSP